MESTPILKKYLIQAGHSLGMQWHFDLEEISRGDVHVSVARLYDNRSLPATHGLARGTQEGGNNDFHSQRSAGLSSESELAP